MDAASEVDIDQLLERMTYNPEIYGGKPVREPIAVGLRSRRSARPRGS